MYDSLPIEPVLRHYQWDGPDLGSNWRPVHCPFHGDQHSSATASEFGFKCYGCGVKGDALGLIRKVEKCDWAGAVLRYEEWSGGSHPELRKTTGRISSPRAPFESRDYERGSGLCQPRIRRRPCEGA